MRAKQHIYRKRLREGEEDGEEVQNGEGFPKAQALPIADLPDDFTGEAEDGATYLALGVRENAALPFVSRVPNPYREPSLPPPLPAGPASPGHDTGDGVELSTVASSSRHPALPKDSWELLFPIHFIGYRKHLAETWPPSPPLPYPTDYPPIPTNVQRSDWYIFMNGYARKKPKKRQPFIPAGADEESMMNAQTSEERAAGEVEAIVDGLDEATAMESAMMGQPEQEEEYRPREPLVAVLQSLNPVCPALYGRGSKLRRKVQTEISKILGHFAFWISESIDYLTPHDMLPTQPSASASPSSRSSPASPFASSDSTLFPRPPTPNPFPARYARWVFALLCVLDTRLSGDDVSSLRELARAAMKVGAWRFIKAVTEGEITEKDGWALGGRWKAARDARPSNSGVGELDGDDETGVDETLARCWMVVHAVAAGWGQRDLVAELDNLFT